MSWKETEIRWNQVRDRDRDRDRTGDGLETTTARSKMDDDAKNASSELQDGVSSLRWLVPAEEASSQTSRSSSSTRCASASPALRSRQPLPAG